MQFKNLQWHRGSFNQHVNIHTIPKMYSGDKKDNEQPTSARENLQQNFFQVKKKKKTNLMNKFLLWNFFNLIPKNVFKMRKGL